MPVANTKPTNSVKRNTVLQIACNYLQFHCMALEQDQLQVPALC